MRLTVRVLFAGITDFDHGVLASLQNDLTEVVGFAEDAEEALRLIELLQPDVVVADPTLIDAAPELAGSTTVVFLSAQAVRSPSPMAGADLAKTVLLLASARVEAQSEEG